MRTEHVYAHVQIDILTACYSECTTYIVLTLYINLTTQYKHVIDKNMQYVQIHTQIYNMCKHVHAHRQIYNVCRYAHTYTHVQIHKKTQYTYTQITYKKIQTNTQLVQIRSNIHAGNTSKQACQIRIARYLTYASTYCILHILHICVFLHTVYICKICVFAHLVYVYLMYASAYWVLCMLHICVYLHVFNICAYLHIMYVCKTYLIAHIVYMYYILYICTWLMLQSTVYCVMCIFAKLYICTHE
jgi:hypothetical protein